MKITPTGKLEEWLAEHGRVDLLGREAELDDDEMLRLQYDCSQSHPNYSDEERFAWAAYTLLTRNVVSRQERESLGEAGAGELAAFSRAAGAQAKAFWAMHGKLETLLQQEAEARGELRKTVEQFDERLGELGYEAKAELARIESAVRQKSEELAHTWNMAVATAAKELEQGEDRAAVRHSESLKAHSEVVESTNRRIEQVEKSVAASLEESRKLAQEAYEISSALSRAVSNTVSKHIDQTVQAVAEWWERDAAETKRQTKWQWVWRIGIALLLLGLLVVEARAQEPHSPIFMEFLDEGTRVKLFAAGIAKTNFTGSGITCTWNVAGKWVGCNVTSGPGAGNSSFSWEDPATSDSGKWASHYAIPATISRVYCSTNTGTVDLNFEIRTEDAPNTTGDQVLTAALQCDSNGASSTTFANSTILPNRLLTPIVSATAGSPGVVRAAAIVNPAGAGSAGNASFSWANPVTGDSGKWQAQYSQAATISKVYCSTDAGTLDLNFQIRTEDFPNSTGTTVLASSLVCTTSGASTAVILNDSIPADRLLTPIVTATSGSPGVVRTTVVTQ